MEKIPTLPHDADEVLDYGFDFTDVLAAGESIASATFALASPAGDTAMTLYTSGARTPTHSATVAKAWVSGGTTGKRYLLTCHALTDASPTRTHDKSLWLAVEVR